MYNSQFWNTDCPRNGRSVPVVSTLGINYTKDLLLSDTTGLFPHLGRNQDPPEPRVGEATWCKYAAALAIAAYNRNVQAWVTPEPNSPLSAYGSINASAKAGLLGTDAKQFFEGGFILVMTNRCPFFTTDLWQNLDPADCNRLMSQWSNDKYLSELIEELKCAVDLWIGHGAIDGTEWVWPGFAELVRRHGISEWLTTPNISPLAHMNLNGWFRKPHHPLYRFFG